jgi:PAS domain S-box-containing protein
MNDQKKTKAELIRELRELRAQQDGPSECYRAGAEETAFWSLCNELLADGRQFALAIAADRVLWANDLAKGTLGYAAAELASISAASILDGALMALLGSPPPEDSPLQGELRTKKGAAVPVAARLCPLPELPDGCRLIVARDLRHRFHAQSALAKSERQFIELFEGMSEGVLITDIESRRILNANPSACRITGYPREELCQLLVDDVHPADELPEIRAVFDDTTGELFHANVDIHFRRRDGSTVLTHIHSVPMELDGKRCVAGIFRDVTESRAQEQALRESRERLEATLHHADALLFLLDAKGIVLSLEGKAVHTLRLDTRNIVGRSLASFHAGEPEVLATIEDALAGSAGQYQSRRQGHVFDCHLSPILDETGTPSGIVIVALDVTEREGMERSLRESQARYRLLVENQTDLFIKFDLEWRVQYVSPNYCATFGVDEASFIGNTFLHLILDDDRPRILASLRSALQPPYQTQHEERARTVDGWRWFSWHARAVLDDAGTPVAMVSVGRDIHEQKLAELALAESNERLSLATVAAGMGIWHYDAVHGRMAWDSRMHELYGTDPATFGGTLEDWRRAVHPEDLPAAQREVDEALADGHGVHSQFRIVRPDGEIRHLESHATVRRHGANGPLVTVTGVNWDVTERVLNEQSLRDSREQYRLLFSTMMEGFSLHEIIVDSEGRPYDYRFLQVNPAFEKLTGLPAAEAVGKTVRELLPGTEPEWIQRYGQVALTGQPARFAGFSKELGSHFEVSAYSPREGQFASLFRDVSKRVADEQALRESEERFREIVNNLAAGVAFCSPAEDGDDFVIRRLNPAAASLAGRNWERYVGQTVRAALPGLAETGFLEVLARVWRSGDAERFPVVRRTAWELSAWYDTFVCRLNVGELVIVFEDRTKQHRSQEAVEQRERQLQSIFTAAPVGIGLLRDGELVTVNDRLCHMVGRDPGELIGQDSGVLHASGREHESVLGELYNQIERQGAGSVETRFRKRDGSFVDVILNAAPFERDDHTKGIAFTALDITERKHNERRIQLEQRVLAALNSGGPQREIIRHILLILQQSTGVEAVALRLRNGEDYPYYVYNGFSEEFIAAEDSLCCEDGAGTTRLACLCGMVLRGESDPERPWFTGNGSFWTNCCSELLADPDLQPPEAFRGRCPRQGYESMALIPLTCTGEVIGLLQLNDRRKNRFTPEAISFYEGLSASIGVSVARERDRDALRRSEERLHEILDAIGVGVMGVDEETDTVIYANPAAARLLEAERTQLLGKQAPILASPIPEAEASDAGASAEAELVATGGTHIPVLRTASAAELDGRACQIESFIDLSALRQAESERQELESRLQQSQRLEAIGTLAGGIAHDFNNILYAILGFAELALDDCPAGSDVRDNVLEIVKSGNRAREIVTQILTFSRQTDREQVPLRLQSSVKEVGKLLRGSIPASISIHTDVDSDCPCVLADPGQMHQVLMNLCTNAYQAMRNRAESLDGPDSVCQIHIRLRPCRLTADEARRHPGLAPGLYAELTVRDTGPGIPPDLLEHVFEPYFTTKTKERGTGLGLAIVSGIVQSHGGAISVESELGVGTTFQVLLPATEALDETTATAPEAVVAGNEHILFVDDEAAIRHLAEHGLGVHGYHVTTASEGRQALDILLRDPDAIDLLVTDLTMPGMSGVELAREVLQLRPDLPILLSTGFADALSRETAAAHGIRDILIKPVPPGELARHIRQILHPSR